MCGPPGAGMRQNCGGDPQKGGDKEKNETVAKQSPALGQGVFSAVERGEFATRRRRGPSIGGRGDMPDGILLESLRGVRCSPREGVAA